MGGHILCMSWPVVAPPPPMWPLVNVSRVWRPSACNREVRLHYAHKHKYFQSRPNSRAELRLACASRPGGQPASRKSAQRPQTNALPREQEPAVWFGAVISIVLLPWRLESAATGQSDQWQNLSAVCASLAAPGEISRFVPIDLHPLSAYLVCENLATKSQHLTEGHSNPAARPDCCIVCEQPPPLRAAPLEIGATS